MQLEGKTGLSVTEACQVARLSRAGFYRHFDEALAVSQQRAHDEMTEMRASISDLLRVATAHEGRLNDLDGKGFQ